MTGTGDGKGFFFLMWKSTTLALTAGLTLAACATDGRSDNGDRRQESGQTLKPGGLLFVTFDANDDYQITREEISAGILGAFAEADANGDGAITMLELSDWSDRVLGGPGARPGRFDFDSNADVRISREEFSNTLNEFAASYAGGDGVIVFNELAQEAQATYLRRERVTPPDQLGGDYDRR